MFAKKSYIKNKNVIFVHNNNHIIKFIYLRSYKKKKFKNHAEHKSEASKLITLTNVLSDVVHEHFNAPSNNNLLSLSLYIPEIRLSFSLINLFVL